MIITSDLDGVLADNTHRAGQLAANPPDWQAVAEAIPHDKPVMPLILMLRLFAARGHVIHILTGRAETTRAATEAWLDKYAVPYHALRMRADDDARPQVLLKRDFIRPYNKARVLFSLEDNPRVVALYRAAGLLTLQPRLTDLTPEHT